MEDRRSRIAEYAFPSSILDPPSSAQVLHPPSLLRYIDAVPFRVVYAVFSKGNPVGPRRTARHAGLFGARLHLFIALHVKAEMIEPDRLFRALIKQRQVEVTVGNEDRRAIRALDFFHVEQGAVKIGQALRLRRIKRYVSDRYGSMFV